ncbi:peptidoglycan DD-metalloendopeptidase family protein [Halomonas sp. PR-M31]|uniref:peptidoglycan DD-metalloendopeptidase family protein n=1 Tax=Halomonas sp. PR-M31 TaxID=1471202 RepID=UPI0006524410|nr:peptidoglycan DD-metalloendopeptidase family protein [Halomonas sp. PR-M31]
MRKAFLVTALALGVAGCAGPNTSPDVRDLSVAREAQSGESVTVQQGDTLYGIAWRQNMDFRDLAKINGITPPYRLQPGQVLQLDGNGQAAPDGGPATTDPRMAQNGVAAGAAGAAGVSGTQAPDWLAPDTEAIERNRRLTSRPMESSSNESSPQAASAQPARSSSSNEQTPANAEQGQGTGGQGPIYNYGTPGADGQLSAQDRAEREQLARQRNQAASQPSDRQSAARSNENAQGASQDNQRGTQQANQTERQPTASNTRPSASSEEATVTGPAADAGTAVAGGADAPSAQQRTYTPVEDVPWQWPVEGQLVGRFSDGSSITAGIDIAGQKGQPVKAAGPGIVVYAGDGVRGYGNLILLKHNDSFLSAYAYNDSLKVRENDVVEAGQVIATMGDTDADGVKLHFEVRQDGQPQDPLKFLPRR